MGGAISDLVSRVSKLERERITHPSYRQAQRLVWITSVLTQNTPIVPGWDAAKKPYADPITIENDGWVMIVAQVYNRNTEGKNEKSRINAYINNTVVVQAVTRVGEGDDETGMSGLYPVRAGDTIMWGSSNNTENPNLPFNSFGILYIPYV